MELNTLHEHPQDVEERIFGRRIQPIEVLQKDDMYDDSTTGKWKPVPAEHVGRFADKNHGVTFIRPA